MRASSVFHLCTVTRGQLCFWTSMLYMPHPMGVFIFNMIAENKTKQ